MDAHRSLARRGSRPRQGSIAPPRGGESRTEPICPRLGQGARGDRTPSPVPRDPRADAHVPRRAPELAGAPVTRAPRPAPEIAPPLVPAAPGRSTASGDLRLRAVHRQLDPRWYQIAMLSALLGYAMFGLHFDLGWGQVAAVIGVALGTQYLCTRLWRLPAYDPLSALISGLGLCTLLRTHGVAPAMAAAALAIGSKFILRWRGKHLFNPTNLALVVMLLTGAGWISPGQYGHVAFAALLMVCMGLTVVCKAARSDVTLAFLGAYAAILFGRSLWLGEPMAIPIHRLQSGLLLQFSFNMISDPRTTPDSRTGRLLFGALVALGAGVVQFALFRTNGPVWSLAACTLLVPLLDSRLPAPRYQWKSVPATAGSTPRGIAVVATAGATLKGANHETPVPESTGALGARPAAVRDAAFARP